MPRIASKWYEVEEKERFAPAYLLETLDNVCKQIKAEKDQKGVTVDSFVETLKQRVLNHLRQDNIEEYAELIKNKP